MPESIAGLTLSMKMSSTHLYTWIERGTVRVKLITQKHNPSQGSNLDCSIQSPACEPLGHQTSHAFF